MGAASRSNRDGKRLDDYLDNVGASERRTVGSALKFALLAEGQGDLYVRFGRTHEWDTAAGQAVLEAAGGSVRTHQGERLRYGKPDFLNDPFIARGKD
jgi:3'(2'), 5'-bisphosphate nucleotidase